MSAKGISQKVAQLTVAAVCATQAHADQAWSDENIDRLLAEMTLEEKVLLTSGRDAWSTQPIDRLDIPFIWMADGPHGLRRAPSTDTWGYGDPGKEALQKLLKEKQKQKEEIKKLKKLKEKELQEKLKVIEEKEKEEEVFI